MEFNHLFLYKPGRRYPGGTASKTNYRSHTRNSTTTGKVSVPPSANKRFSVTLGQNSRWKWGFKK